MPTDTRLPSQKKSVRFFTRKDFEKGLCDENGIAINKGAVPVEEEQTPVSPEGSGQEQTLAQPSQPEQPSEPATEEAAEPTTEAPAEPETASEPEPEEATGDGEDGGESDEEPKQGE